MNRSQTWLSAALSAATLAITVSAFGWVPPTAEDLTTLNEQFIEWYQNAPAEEKGPDMLGKKLEELYADVDFSELDMDGLMAASMYAQVSPEMQEKIARRLEHFKEDQGADGAAATAMGMRTALQNGPEAAADAFNKLLNHPGLDEALSKGQALDIFHVMPYLDEATLAGSKDKILGLSKHFAADASPETIMVGAGYLDALKTMDVEQAKIDEVRTQVVDALKAQIKSTEDEQMAKAMKNQLTFLDGAYARGELIDHAAPELNFNWTSEGLDAETLSDLSGKVVVLDFWATWCGPCIASFPNIKELTEKYDGLDVVVIGVTSLQGKHYPGNGADAIDTEGNPEKEYELMTQFMADSDINWHIAFTEEEVFNGEYGVQGIPHMTIIDAEGKVRYNGLHPSATSLEEKSEKIDALLKEAGLKVPATEIKKDEKKADDQGDHDDHEGHDDDGA